MVIDPFGKVVGQLSGEPLYDRIRAGGDRNDGARVNGSGRADNRRPASWQPVIARGRLAVLFRAKFWQTRRRALFITTATISDRRRRARHLRRLVIVGSGGSGFSARWRLRPGASSAARAALAGDVLYWLTREFSPPRSRLAARTVRAARGPGRQDST